MPLINTNDPTKNRTWNKSLEETCYIRLTMGPNNLGKETGA